MNRLVVLTLVVDSNLNLKFEIDVSQLKDLNFDGTRANIMYMYLVTQYGYAIEIIIDQSDL